MITSLTAREVNNRLIIRGRLRHRLTKIKVIRLLIKKVRNPVVRIHRPFKGKFPLRHTRNSSRLGIRILPKSL